MVRTQIYLTEDETDALTALAESSARSRSEIIRHALDIYLGLEQNSAVEKRRAAFGIWAGRKRDGVSFQRKLRGEWER